jgi:hypothetical protein
MPWIRRRVLVSKAGHPLKGKHGVVLNVLPRQNTPSGLRIEVEIIDYDPNIPFQKVVFDYDDLKDLKYVSQYKVHAPYSNGLIPGIRLSYTTLKSPPSTNQIIVLHLFSAIRSQSPLRTHTCTRPCIRLLVPHQCGPPMLPSTPLLPGTHPPLHLCISQRLAGCRTYQTHHRHPPCPLLARGHPRWCPGQTQSLRTFSSTRKSWVLM